MKKYLALFLSFLLFTSCMPIVAFASDDENDGQSATAFASDFSVDAPSSVLMEAETGTILFAQNADTGLPPASVTKIMTLLLVMEALKDQKIAEDDMVTVSEYAASMGGSQVFLEAGEQFSVRELIKCTVIASANDAAVALAEHVAGSEEAFVAAMNERAGELCLKETHFENVTGLDDTVKNHVMSASDIAVISRELIRFPLITEYSSTWMDSFRNGEFTLTNTNRLIRFYPGATGLKTGSTAKAKFCLTATAQRDGMTLIAVVMGADSRDKRNTETMKMLDWGFANYALYVGEETALPEIHVNAGTRDHVSCQAQRFAKVVKKGDMSRITCETVLPDQIAAPVQEKDVIGVRKYFLEEEVIGEAPILASETIEKISFMKLFEKMLQTFLHLG